MWAQSPVLCVSSAGHAGSCHRLYAWYRSRLASRQMERSQERGVNRRMESSICWLTTHFRACVLGSLNWCAFLCQALWSALVVHRFFLSKIINAHFFHCTKMCIFFSKKLNLSFKFPWRHLWAHKGRDVCKTLKKRQPLSKRARFCETK